MDAINQVWPNWHTEEVIGTGAFGKVYKAKREEMGNISYAAVKIMHIPHDTSEIKDLQRSGMDEVSVRAYYEDLIKNLLNEIKIMESLKGANNIVVIEDYQVVAHEDEIAWDIYIRMEYLTGLGTYLEEKQLTVSDVIRLGKDICTALQACEKVHIIHRDIKIDNVFINPFGSFKLGDFGISKQLEKTRSALSRKGTEMYMAPEVIRGEAYDRSVDIYSLGIMMYRMVNNGRFPFMPPAPQMLYIEDSQRALDKRLSGEKITAPQGLDRALADVIEKACSFDPKDRYQSASEMFRDLIECDGAKKSVDPLKGETKRYASKKKSIKIISLAAVLTVALAGLIGVVIYICSEIGSFKENRSGAMATEKNTADTDTEESIKGEWTGLVLNREILRIRDVYDSTMEACKHGKYTVRNVSEYVSAYCDEGGAIHRIHVNAKKDPLRYTRDYYFENEKLIFAYFAAEDAHRLYFYNENLFRWRYAQDASEPTKSENHDYGDSPEFYKWEMNALADGKKLYEEADKKIRQE